MGVVDDDDRTAWISNGWNAGDAPSGGFSNGFYLSHNATITTADTYLTGNGNFSLDPGESFVWGNPDLPIPAGTPPGSYYLGILVDNEEKNWNAWGNSMWPSVYLIDKQGHIRYTHIGEGAYQETEAAIQTLLNEPYEQSSN